MRRCRSRIIGCGFSLGGSVWDAEVVCYSVGLLGNCLIRYCSVCISALA